MFFYFGCGSKYCAMQKDTVGALKYSEAKQSIQWHKDLIMRLRNNNSGDTNNRLSAIGHAAGSYQQYPIDISLPSDKKVSELILDSIKTHDLNGIEIDVQIDKSGDVYVTHDRIIGDDKENIKQINKNSEKLNEVITTIYKNGLNNDIRLFIELKTSSQEVTDIDELLINGILKSIKYGIDNKSFQNKILNNISFISFNYNMLKKFHDENKKIGIVNFRLYQIIASSYNKLLTWCICPAFSVLNVDLLKKDDILTGIWFDPKGIPDFTTAFNEINNYRKNKAYEIYISTYGLSKDSYVKALKKNKEGLRNITGLIFDIQRP